MQIMVGQSFQTFSPAMRSHYLLKIVVRRQIGPVVCKLPVRIFANFIDRETFRCFRIRIRIGLEWGVGSIMQAGIRSVE